MASIVKISNGVTCTINPAVFKTDGPSRQAIEFTSQPNSAASLPITISFDSDVTDMSIVVVGLSNSSHVTRAFDNSGNLIISQVTRTNNPDSGRGGGIETISITSPRSFRKIELRPISDFVGYRDLQVLQTVTSAAPIEAVPQTTPTPPTLLAPTITTINLLDFVELNVNVIDIQYVKGNLSNPSPVKIKVKNKSSDIGISITLAGIAGVTFDPASFDLPRTAEREVMVNFDGTEIEKLNEGVNIINAVVNISSNETIMPPLPAPIIIPPIVEPLPKNEPAKTPAPPTFSGGGSGGSGGSRGSSNRDETDIRQLT